MPEIDLGNLKQEKYPRAYNCGVTEHFEIRKYSLPPRFGKTPAYFCFHDPLNPKDMEATHRPRLILPIVNNGKLTSLTGFLEFRPNIVECHNQKCPNYKNPQSAAYDVRQRNITFLNPVDIFRHKAKRFLDQLLYKIGF